MFAMHQLRMLCQSLANVQFVCVWCITFRMCCNGNNGMADAKTCGWIEDRKQKNTQINKAIVNDSVSIEKRKEWILAEITVDASGPKYKISTLNVCVCVQRACIQRVCLFVVCEYSNIPHIFCSYLRWRIRSSFQWCQLLLPLRRRHALIKKKRNERGI